MGHLCTYRNTVASSSGQVDVVWVGRHPVSPGDKGCHIFTDAVNTLAGAVGSCETTSEMIRGKMSTATK